MTAATKDAPSTSLPATEPAVSWALVQAFVQAAILLGDVTMFGSWRPEVLGAVHGVFAAAIAIAGAVYTRNRTTTNAALDTLAAVVPAPAADVAEQTAQRVLQLMPQPVEAELDTAQSPVDEVHVGSDASRAALAGLYELVTGAAPSGSWTRARIADELRNLGAEVYRAAS